ncbi:MULTISPECIES: cytochrome C oxidase subunit IV family protein [Halomonadaceae]|uniref:cytochrome C oxidase subunit IV family protein n=1 Tax=Halomonas TaxID=2745 RepID=UPI0018A70822|nr:cytochrome C oxidase subunit IV family protein [Halomonas sp. 328]MBF8222113.1 cytochrome C oxidase subunit IV family protein [Halomonas sp. 328]
MSEPGQGAHPPLRAYLWVWLALFILSVFSYWVDYAGLEGYLKWFLITAFMLLKAGLIMAVFMHLAWERPSIVVAVLLPPGALLFLAALMALESHYTLLSRLRFFFS